MRYSETMVSWCRRYFVHKPSAKPTYDGDNDDRFLLFKSFSGGVHIRNVTIALIVFALVLCMVDETKNSDRMFFGSDAKRSDRLYGRYGMPHIVTHLCHAAVLIGIFMPNALLLVPLIALYSYNHANMFIELIKRVVHLASMNSRYRPVSAWDTAIPMSIYCLFWTFAIYIVARCSQYLAWKAEQKQAEEAAQEVARQIAKLQSSKPLMQESV